jgi:death on curing protein
MEPLFLTLDEVLFVHREQIARYGGSDGLRDLKLLQSALGQPEAGFGGTYLHNDLFEMAAAYLFHIAQNHPFVDGNKRVGLECALLFREINGISINAPDDVLESITMETAQGNADKTAIAAVFREHAS